MSIQEICATLDEVKKSETIASANRIDAILRASIPVFAERGYRGTSMSNIAEAAGMSRPALYQYFTDRSDLFVAALQLLFDEYTDVALEALTATGSLSDQLDGFLQRLHGDAYAALMASSHGEELLDAHHQFASQVSKNANGRALDALRKHLQANTQADRRVQTKIVELLALSIAGFKQDHPTTVVYRRRLAFLAEVSALALN